VDQQPVENPPGGALQQRLVLIFPRLSWLS
jgi:hypothetical protein